MNMTVQEAIKEVRSVRDRAWLRWQGKDFLAEHEVMKFKAAALVLADAVEAQEIGKPV